MEHGSLLNDVVQVQQGITIFDVRHRVPLFPVNSCLFLVCHNDEWSHMISSLFYQAWYFRTARHMQEYFIRPVFGCVGTHTWQDPVHNYDRNVRSDAILDGNSEDGYSDDGFFERSQYPRAVNGPSPPPSVDNEARRPKRRPRESNKVGAQPLRGQRLKHLRGEGGEPHNAGPRRKDERNRIAHDRGKRILAEKEEWGTQEKLELWRKGRVRRPRS